MTWCFFMKLSPLSVVEQSKLMCSICLFFVLSSYPFFSRKRTTHNQLQKLLFLKEKEEISSQKERVCRGCTTLGCLQTKTIVVTRRNLTKTSTCAFSF